MTMQVRLQTGQVRIGHWNLFVLNGGASMEFPGSSLETRLLQNVIPTDNFCQPGRVVLGSKSGAPQK